MNSSSQGTNSKLTQNNMGKPEDTCGEEKHGIFKSRQLAKKGLRIILWLVCVWFFIWVLVTVGELKHKLEAIENKVELLSVRIDKGNESFTSDVLELIHKKDEIIKNALFDALSEMCHGIRNEVLDAVRKESEGIRKEVLDVVRNVEQKITGRHSENKIKISDNVNSKAQCEDLMNRRQNIIKNIMRDDWNKSRRSFGWGKIRPEDLTFDSMKARIEADTKAIDKEIDKVCQGTIEDRFNKNNAMIGERATKAGVLTDVEFDKKFNAITDEVKVGQKTIAEKIETGRAGVINERDKLKKTVEEEIEKGRLLVHGGLTKSLTQQLDNIGNSLDADIRIGTEKKDDKHDLTDKTKK